MPGDDDRVLVPMTPGAANPRVSDMSYAAVAMTPGAANPRVSDTSYAAVGTATPLCERCYSENQGRRKETEAITARHRIESHARIFFTHPHSRWKELMGLTGITIVGGAVPTTSAIAARGTVAEDTAEDSTFFFCPNVGND